MKKKFVVVLTILMLMSFIAGCSSNENTSNHIGKDVTVESMKPYINTGDYALYICTNDNGITFYLLGFYADGKVIAAWFGPKNPSDIATSLHNAVTWFNKDNEGVVLIGNYGDGETFTVENIFDEVQAPVDYTCALMSNGNLSYSTRSQDTGKGRVGIYEYVGFVSGEYVMIDKSFEL